MKKLLTLLLLTLSAFALAACGNDDEKDDNGNGNGDTNDRPSSALVNLLTFSHIDGYGNIVERDMPILFEFELRDVVKYQVAFVACTCRAPRYNYWSVMYLELNKNTGEVEYISFGRDGEDKYDGGMWGDSDPIPRFGVEDPSDPNYLGWVEFADLQRDFLPWFLGMTSEDLDGINIFYNDAPSQYAAAGQANDKHIDEEEMIDALTGASVSTNNIIRVVKAMLAYHEDKYLN